MKIREYKRRLVLVKYIMNYLNNTRGVFLGSVSFDGGSYESLKITYKHKNKEEFLCIPIRTKGYYSPISEIKDLIQDFLLSMYYEYERDGKTPKFDDIACILGISEALMMKIWKNLKDKVRVNYSKLTKKQ